MITQETKIIEVNPSGIPDFLKALPYWINWKPVFVDGKQKNCRRMAKPFCAGSIGKRKDDLLQMRYVPYLPTAD